MPQFTRLPPLPPGPYGAAVERFVAVLRGWPAEGESFRTLRGRLKQAELWHRDHADDLWRFLQVPVGEFMRPSSLVLAMAAADRDAALDAVADRLWAINPVLAHAILSRVTERVHTANELLKYVESFAFPGVRLTGPQVHGWLRWAQGLELLRTVGVGLGLGERARRFADRIKRFDVDEYLEEDEDEPELVAAPGDSAPAEGSPPPPAVSAEPPPAADVAGVPPPSPGPAAASPPPARIQARDPACLKPEQPVSLVALRAGIDGALRAGTRAHLQRWWAEHSAPDDGAADPLSAEGIGLGGEAWMEDPLRVMFRLAVSAGLQFAPGRSPGHGRAALAALDAAGLIDALHEGTLPQGPMGGVDPEALLLASLVARRLAEHPGLPEALERCADAAAAFGELQAALGGLFTVELFWILRALTQAGILRLTGAADYTALPHRDIRDTLFRLGFLDSPYAGSPSALATAAAAARDATGGAPAPERLLRAFAAGAGCAYGCAQAQRCQVACRERLELG